MAVTVETIGSATSTTTGTTINVNAPASIAVGDLLIAHIVSENAMDTPGTWNLIRSNTSSTANIAVFYRVATISDVGATTYAFTSAASGPKGARMFRISGADTISPINVSDTGSAANSSTVTVPSIDPTVGDTFFMFFVGALSAGLARTCSGYTMVTSAPTYSEHYDEQFDSNNYQLSAASGTRSADTASGSNTATLSGSDPNVGVVIAVNPLTLSPTSTPATLIATFSIPVPAATNGANSTPALITATFTLNVPTPTAVAPTWSNQSRGTASFTNQDKGSASWSNQEKGSSTWTNQSKS